MPEKHESIKTTPPWVAHLEQPITHAESVLPRSFLGTTILGIHALLEAGLERDLDDVSKHKVDELQFDPEVIERANLAGNTLHGKLYAVSGELGGDMDQIPEISEEDTTAIFHKATKDIQKKWNELNISSNIAIAERAFSALADLFRSTEFEKLLKEYRITFTTKPIDGVHADREAVQEKIRAELLACLESIDANPIERRFIDRLAKDLTFDTESHLDKWRYVHGQIYQGITHTPQGHLMSSVLGINALLEKNIEPTNNEVEDTFSHTKIDLKPLADLFHKRYKTVYRPGNEFIDKPEAGEQVSGTTSLGINQVIAGAANMIGNQWNRVVKKHPEQSREVFKAAASVTKDLAFVEASEQLKYSYTDNTEESLAAEQAELEKMLVMIGAKIDELVADNPALTDCVSAFKAAYNINT